MARFQNASQKRRGHNGSISMSMDLEEVHTDPLHFHFSTSPQRASCSVMLPDHILTDDGLIFMQSSVVTAMEYGY